ncbi:MAG: hypothetical protein BGO98_41840 [Myxococcales bacterium 68-20]|nr:MAG: hypothetical protein BGO98_41840 [Myxococcales bacterium 68-20]
MSSDPPRIADLEGGQPAEVELVRAAIRGYREELPPLSAMPAALHAARTGRRSWTATSHLLWPGLSALAVALTLGTAWLAWPRNPERDAAAPVPPRHETASASSSEATPAPTAPSEVVTPNAPAEAAPVPAPVFSVDSLPSAKHRPAPARPAAPAKATCSDEVDLIDDADAALRAGNAERAYALTRQHAERCPAGTFIQERERIAIEALAKLGRLDAMRERARAFEERFPSSPHLRRVRNVVERHGQ